MGVRRHRAVRTRVYTGEILVLGVACFEGAVACVVRGVVGASNTIEDVFAVVGGVGAVWVAGFEAEGVGADEARK